MSRLVGTPSEFEIMSPRLESNSRELSVLARVGPLQRVVAKKRPERPEPVRVVTTLEAERSVKRGE